MTTKMPGFMRATVEAPKDRKDVRSPPTDLRPKHSFDNMRARRPFGIPKPPAQQPQDDRAPDDFPKSDTAFSSAAKGVSPEFGEPSDPASALNVAKEADNTPPALSVSPQLISELGVRTKRYASGPWLVTQGANFLTIELGQHEEADRVAVGVPTRLQITSPDGNRANCLFIVEGIKDAATSKDDESVASGSGSSDEATDGNHPEAAL